MLEAVDLDQKVDKVTYKMLAPILRERLYAVQMATWDAGVPVVILFEGWDAAGKGSSIQSLTMPIDPRGFKLYPIRAARTYETNHPWLWRFWLKLPARGEWAIFDRSWYGRVLVERMEEIIPETEWRRAYRDIADFERTIADDGHLIIKFFLHISKKEQKRRFEKLVEDPLTAWHVAAEDWEHHRRYDNWFRVYEEMFENTETEWGPWTIVEATDRRHTQIKVFQTIIQSIENKLGISTENIGAEQVLDSAEMLNTVEELDQLTGSRLADRQHALEQDSLDIQEENSLVSQSDALSVPEKKHGSRRKSATSIENMNGALNEGGQIDVSVKQP